MQRERLLDVSDRLLVVLFDELAQRLPVGDANHPRLVVPVDELLHLLRPLCLVVHAKRREWPQSALVSAGRIRDMGEDFRPQLRHHNLVRVGRRLQRFIPKGAEAVQIADRRLYAFVVHQEDLLSKPLAEGE